MVVNAKRGLFAIAALTAVLGVGGRVDAAEGSKTSLIFNADRAGFEPDRGSLRAMFTLRVTVWPDGEPVRVFVLPDQSPVHDLFCREQLGTYPYVLRTVWDRKIFTGVALAPIEVRSEGEMREKVLSTPGAIGYIGPSLASFLPEFLLELAAMDAGPSDD